MAGFEAEQESAGAPEEREHQTFGEKLADDASPAAAEREPNGNFFAAGRPASQQHVREIQTRHEQHHDRHAEKHRPDF